VGHATRLGEVDACRTLTNKWWKKDEKKTKFTKGVIEHQAAGIAGAQTSQAMDALRAGRCGTASRPGQKIGQHVGNQSIIRRIA